MTTASQILDEWERLEGESMRDGHRQTLERLISAALYSLQAEAEEVPSLELTIESYQRQLDSLRKQLADAMKDAESASLDAAKHVLALRAAEKQLADAQAWKEIYKTGLSGRADRAERSLQSLKDRVRAFWDVFWEVFDNDGDEFESDDAATMVLRFEETFPDILATQTEEER